MRYKIFLILWIVIIFVLSSISGNSLQKVPKINIPHLDKLVHFAMYSILQYLFILYYSKQKNKYSLNNYLLLTCLFSILYSIAMELAQTYIFVKRSGDLYDIIANVVGVILLIILFRLNILKKLRFI